MTLVLVAVLTVFAMIVAYLASQLGRASRVDPAAEADAVAEADRRISEIENNAETADRSSEDRLSP